MKTLGILALSLTAALALSAQLQSQIPAAPKTPLQVLQEMKVKNGQLLEKQAATLTRLDELQKQAAQLRFVAARS